MLKQGLLVLVFAAVAAAQCGKGEMVDACCICSTGWKLGASEQCDECAEGFVYDSTNNICSNGRKGSICSSELEYPYFGCTIDAVTIGECSTGGVFPCVCPDKSCEQARAQAAQCYPTGTRMYTTFPNLPTVGKDFSLTFVGCEISSADTYAVIPAWNADLTAERMCSSLGTSETAGIPEKCVFTGPQNAELGGNKTDTCSGTDGFLLKGLSEQSGTVRDGMTEYTFEPINMLDESVFVGTDKERARANRQGGNNVGEKETLFRVCKLAWVKGKSGAPEVVWAEMANHNEGVTERDGFFKISKTGNADPDARAAADGEGGGDDCCDGLQLGSLCLPLWVFLLLWLLMASCLGAMGFMLHKNKNEIEAQKNNEKYENFQGVDAEMSAMAAKRDDDDDDI